MKKVKKDLVYNSVSNIILQIVTFICGLIVPKLILETFGSSINGSIQSITQFLNYIVLLEAGVGGVTKAALYKPLTENNYVALNGIINATEAFFKKICYIFIVYMLVLAAIYSYMVSDTFEYLYTFSLVVIIGLGTVAQYYFGITAQIFLSAAQKGYIYIVLQIVSVVLNNILIYVLIKLRMNIHIVKFFSAIVYVARPVLLSIYIKSKYKFLDKSVPPDNGLIAQRWDGFAQHIAFFVHNNTDIVILTCFQELKTVSVYSVYYMIVSGLEKLISCISAGFTPAIGHLIALENREKTLKAVDVFELLCFTSCSIVMTICAVMIVPFVSIYTKGVTDANYIDYRFGVLMVLSSTALLLRNVYQNIVLSAGHYKQTNRSAYIETVLNIGISLCLVRKYGLSGVAFGTFVSLAYRLIYYVIYLSKNILYRSKAVFVKRLCVNLLALVIDLAIILPNIGKFKIDNYFDWVICSIAVTLTVSIVVLVINGFFYKNDLRELLCKIKRRRTEGDN